jgi:hypothetical protein
MFLREETSSGNGSQFIVKELLSTQVCLNHRRPGDNKIVVLFFYSKHGLFDGKIQSVLKQCSGKYFNLRK